MSLHIFKYSFSVGSFVSLQQLDFFKEFGIFSTFKEFNDLQDVLSFKDLQSVQDSKGFKELKEFKSFKEFEGFLSYLHVLSYYKDFKLLLCSSCNIALSPANLKGHLAKHFLDLKGKVKEGVILKAISILQELEVSALSLSLDLINSFSIAYTLSPFQELDTLEGLLKCSFCPHIGLNKQSMQRHLRGQHIDLRVSNLPNSYTVVAKGQGLEPTRFFFQVETKNKGKGRDTQGGGEEEEEGLHPPNSPSLNLEEGDPFAQASRLFLREFHSKKEALYSNFTRYSLSKEETLSLL
jgi:Orsellinic acid/F9775 biosynthesis cluster protein D